MSKKNRKIKLAIIHSLYEYFLIVLPVLIFVAIESTHKGWEYLYKSPEWSIATIFLSLQSIALFRTDLRKSGRQISELIFNVFRLITIVVVVLASINIYSSLDDEHNTLLNILIRWLFFLITSISFFFLVTAGKSIKE